MSEAVHNGEGEGNVDFVCTSCRASPRVIQYAHALGVFLHAAVIRTQVGIDEVCGGLVVPRDAEWRVALMAGKVVPCAPLRRRGAHQVRIGHPTSSRNGSWTGTSLCGFVQTATTHWIPVDPAVAEKLDPCPRCVQALTEGGGG